MKARTKGTAIRIGLAAVAASLVLAGPAAADRPDPWITTKAKIALLTDSDVSGLDINVDTIDGRVTLHGTVASEAEKSKAETIVRGVEGVTDVTNTLKVVAAAADESDMKVAAKVDDDELERRVNDAMKKDQSLAGTDIEVDIENGIVTLEGDAKTMSEHRRALQTVREVDGVVQVKDDINGPGELDDSEVWHDTKREAKAASDETARVAEDAADDAEAKAHDAEHDAKAMGSGATSAAKDMWITTATKVRLMANDATPALRVNVDTNDGEVTLFGSVPSDAARQVAEAEARKVDGVVNVKNELQVVTDDMKEDVEAQDSDLKDAISKKIETRSELKDADIDVEVSNGVARLTGTVQSQTGRLTALTTARSVPGVRSAIDDLEIEAGDDDAATANEPPAAAETYREEKLETMRDSGPYDADSANDAGDAPLR